MRDPRNRSAASRRAAALHARGVVAALVPGRLEGRRRSLLGSGLAAQQGLTGAAQVVPSKRSTCASITKCLLSPTWRRTRASRAPACDAHRGSRRTPTGHPLPDAAAGSRLLRPVAHTTKIPARHPDDRARGMPRAKCAEVASRQRARPTVLVSVVHHVVAILAGDRPGHMT